MRTDLEPLCDNEFKELRDWLEPYDANSMTIRRLPNGPFLRKISFLGRLSNEDLLLQLTRELNFQTRLDRFYDKDSKAVIEIQNHD